MKYRPLGSIIAKNSKLGMVCLYGLGVTGHGTMWVKEQPKHKERDGYAEAPEEEVPKVLFGEVNLQ